MQTVSATSAGAADGMVTNTTASAATAAVTITADRKLRPVEPSSKGVADCPRSTTGGLRAAGSPRAAGRGSARQQAAGHARQVRSGPAGDVSQRPTRWTDDLVERIDAIFEAAKHQLRPGVLWCAARDSNPEPAD